MAEVDKQLSVECDAANEAEAEQVARPEALKLFYQMGATAGYDAFVPDSLEFDFAVTMDVAASMDRAARKESASMTWAVLVGLALAVLIAVAASGTGWRNALSR
jgi:hypothetical protein